MRWSAPARWSSAGCRRTRWCSGIRRASSGGSAGSPALRQPRDPRPEPMDFSWSDEQRKFRQTVVDFARRELNEGARERDAEGRFPRDLWRKCAEFGILALPLPEAYGGSGSDALTTTLAMEALGYGCSDQGFLFSIHAHMWAVEIPLLHFGTDAQKERYLPRLADGTWVAAHGISEPNSGSDAFAMATTAERRGDRYILNGAKTFVTNAPVADLFLAFASVDRKKG